MAQLQHQSWRPVLLPHAILVKSPDIDLVISDLNMAGMDGVKLNLLMQEQNIRRPFILCTGNPEMISHEQFKKLNLCALIAKPYMFAALEKCIEAIASAKSELQLLRPSRMVSDNDDG